MLETGRVHSEVWGWRVGAMRWFAGDRVACEHSGGGAWDSDHVDPTVGEGANVE